MNEWNKLSFTKACKQYSEYFNADGVRRYNTYFGYYAEKDSGFIDWFEKKVLRNGFKKELTMHLRGIKYGL